MKLIDLTKINFIDFFTISYVKSIKLNPEKIISMNQENNVTRLNLKGGTTIYVKETIEKIKELVGNTNE